LGRYSVLIVLAFLVASCGGEGPGRDASSITVKLPPARPYVPAPAFSFAATAGKSRGSN